MKAEKIIFKEERGGGQRGPVLSSTPPQKNKFLGNGLRALEKFSLLNVYYTSPSLAATSPCRLTSETDDTYALPPS